MTASSARSGAGRRTAARPRSSSRSTTTPGSSSGSTSARSTSPAPSSTSAARSAAPSSCPSTGATATPPWPLVYHLLDGLLDGIAAPLLGIGIGTPGLVDSRTGTIRRAVNLDWRDLPLGAIVAERYGVPVNVANDSQAAALAEYTYAGGVASRT